MRTMPGCVRRCSCRLLLLIMPLWTLLRPRRSSVPQSLFAGFTIAVSVPRHWMSNCKLAATTLLSRSCHCTRNTCLAMVQSIADSFAVPVLHSWSIDRSCLMLPHKGSLQKAFKASKARIVPLVSAAELQLSRAFSNQGPLHVGFNGQVGSCEATSYPRLTFEETGSGAGGF